MGYIQTQIQIDGKKLSFETESSELHQLNFLSHMHTIHTPDKILSILIIKDMIILLTEDRDFRNGALHTPIYRMSGESTISMLMIGTEGTCGISEILSAISKHRSPVPR